MGCSMAANLKPAARRCRGVSGERGDTLIEVLVAVAILGIASVALLTAFSTAITASAEHRVLATSDSVARSAAEAVFSEVEQASPAAYQQCPASYSNVASSLTSPSGSASPVVPSTYTVALSVEYWNGSAFAPAATVSSCPSDLTAPQQITVTVTPVGRGIPESIAVVVTDPQYIPPTTTTVP